jgi:hypothetical protein
MTKTTPARQLSGSVASSKISRRGSLRELHVHLVHRAACNAIIDFLFSGSAVWIILAQAGDPAFEQKIAIYVSAHSSRFRNLTKHDGPRYRWVLPFGREGKLLNAGVPKNVVSAADEASILAALRRIQPFRLSLKICRRPITIGGLCVCSERFSQTQRRWRLLRLLATVKRSSVARTSVAISGIT